MSFASLGLCSATLKAVQTAGYTTPTDIQRRAIPLVLQGRDIIGCAPTGTGKTAAFVLPILVRLTRTHDPARHVAGPRVLVLTPTRELAQQVHSFVTAYGAGMGVRSVAVYGGASMHEQLQALRRGVQIVAATPGRLLDHIQRRTIDLRGVEVLVLDEADRMYDMGFIHDVRRIVALTPRGRQTLLFSATMPPEIRSLVAEIQRDPVSVDVGRVSAPPDTVTQRFYGVPQPAKTDLLVHILRSEPIQTMLVFSRTKRGADRLAHRLSRQGISCAAIHADRSQHQRDQALEGFKRRHFRVLVATDVAARGIDVTGISHVVNFDTPAFAEDYVHRIGRTGRAEATGTALTFVSSEERKYLKRIEYLTNARCQLERYPGFDGCELPEPPREVSSAPSFGRTQSRMFGGRRLGKWRGHGHRSRAA